MAYSLSFHNEAENDFDAIYNWYESQDIKLAERFSAQLNTKFGQILEAPETYGAKSKKGYREATLKDFPYSIVYKIFASQHVIFISSIHHHKLNPSKKFRV